MTATIIPIKRTQKQSSRPRNHKLATVADAPKRRQELAILCMDSLSLLEHERSLKIRRGVAYRKLREILQVARAIEVIASEEEA